MLYLHVGLHKTGTSAIQTFLHENEQALRSLGYDYTPIGRGERAVHYPLGRELLEQAPADPRLGGIAELAKHCRKASGHLIVSSESFGRANPAQVRQLGQHMAGLPLTVILYLRHPAELIQSSYFQQAKVGINTAEFEHHLERALRGARLRFHDQACKWSQLAGSEVRIRLYENGQLVNDDLIDDFLTAIDAPSLIGHPALKKQPPINASPGPKTIVLLQELTRRLGPEGSLSPEARRLLLRVRGAATAAGWDRERITLLTDAQVARIEQRCAEQMERVARDILGRADGRLFYRRPRTSEAALPTLAELPQADLVGILLAATQPATSTREASDEEKVPPIVQPERRDGRRPRPAS